MKQRALPYFQPHAQNSLSIDALDKVYSRLMAPKRATVTLGEGELRARQRAAAQRAATADTPMEDIDTRQRRRQTERLRTRQIVTLGKREASRKIQGGSAVIRQPVDVDAFLR